MSTFNGEIEEIPEIAVDNFTNGDKKCYFLSHCHTDHLQGIASLQHREIPIYTTELSALILKDRYHGLTVKCLELGFTTSFQFDKGQFVVQFLSGGHCLGSCMILFQIEGHDILYTGDFRICLNDVKNIKTFKEIKNSGKLQIYLDTTFMRQQYEHFPRQEESCNKIVEITREHLSKSLSNKVNIKVPARYGYERLIIELNRKLNEQIFIDEEEVMQQYLLISELSSCISLIKLNSRICMSPTYRKFDTEDSNCLIIHLSAMFWKYWKPDGSITHEIDKRTIRICYATHNSLSELRDFLKYLAPKAVYATVEPENREEKEKMSRLISETLCSNRSEPKNSFRFKKLRLR